jgi:hypothetical protein
MDTVMLKLPEDVATRLEEQHITRQQLEPFLVAAVRAWLARSEQKVHRADTSKRPWSEAFRESAVAFVDQLIDENQALFEELARL